MSRPVDVLAVMASAHATFDNLRFERRSDAKQDAHWTGRIAEMIEARAAVAELVEEVRDLLYSHPAAQTYPDGPCIERQQRAALAAALARIGGAS